MGRDARGRVTRFGVVFLLVGALVALVLIVAAPDSRFLRAIAVLIGALFFLAVAFGPQRWRDKKIIQGRDDAPPLPELPLPVIRVLCGALGIALVVGAFATARG